MKGRKGRREEGNYEYFRTKWNLTNNLKTSLNTEKGSQIIRNYCQLNVKELNVNTETIQLV
jgi:hypothetical protein